MTARTAVISGAGVAGPALAAGLARSGWRVVVVEQAPTARLGGQTVDLRGAGERVIAHLGLTDEVRGRALVQRGAAWVRADGTHRTEMPVTAFDGNGLVSATELLRGDLVDVLLGATADAVDYRFGTRVVAVEDAPAAAPSTGAAVTLSDGETLRADVVVGADGLHSGVRTLVFGALGPAHRRSLGGYTAWFTAPDTVGVDGWWLIYSAPGGRTATVRPSRDPATVKAGLTVTGAPPELDRHDPAAAVAVLAERFAGAGWHCDALVEAARHADDFHLDELVQIRLPTLSRGPVTLVGDAGWCASPLSGMGTSLALVGAHLLAAALGPADGGREVGAGLRAYEEAVEPHVTRGQRLANTLDRFAPATASDIVVTAAVLRWAQRWPLRPLARRAWFSGAPDEALPG